MLRYADLGRSALSGLLILASLALTPVAFADLVRAPDGIAVSGANGNQTDIFGIGTYWNSLCACAPLKALGFDTRLAAQVAYWHGKERPTDHESLWEASVTPYLRWMTPAMGPVALFAEAGVGASFLSATRINTERHFGSSFQFNEQGNIGIAFGPRNRYELAGFVRHVSNGGIKQPNNGITVFGGVFRVGFE
jgi:lipid A 3-O-deacylase